MLVRPLRAEDLPGVLALQEANLHASLSDTQRAHGFLSARFDAGQFTDMARQVGVSVALDGAQVAGYACASEVEYNRRFPLLAAMIAALPEASFGGGTLEAARAFVYGPVCVDSAWRGKGVLRGLVDALRRRASGRFECGIALIAEDNAHSLAAHVQGLGMQRAGGFVHEGRAYHIVAFPV